MEPSVVLPLRASYKEYEDLGEKHQKISERIEDLQERMKETRKRGAFKQLQDQMAEVKRLVKEREDVDARMSVLDLARKKQDDFNVARGVETSYSESIRSVEERIATLERELQNFSESYGKRESRNRKA
jgi:prefoldin subunit 5